jgi:hypothetical protein
MAAMFSVKRHLLLAGVLLLVPTCVVVLMGCGGSGSGGEDATADQSTSGRPLTKAEFGKELERICDEGVKEKTKAFIKFGNTLNTTTKPSPAEMKKLVEVVVIAPYSETVAQLSELQLPEGDKTAVAIVRGYEAALEETEADPAKSVQTSPFVKVDKMAIAHGFKACIL